MGLILVNITNTPAWKAYVVASETVIRVGPCVVLVCLNTAMIVSFRASMKRRRDLRPPAKVPSAVASSAAGADNSNQTNPGKEITCFRSFKNREI